MINCICGSQKTTAYKRKTGIWINSKGRKTKRKIELVECSNCGIVRQSNLKFKDEKGYSEYYHKEYPPTKNTYSEKDYEHDRDVARLRADAHGITGKSGRILDVGSGSGAFVDECRDRDVKAFGCEIGDYHYMESDEHIYKELLNNINFPTDHFDTVTCHDVIEHVLNPVEFLKDMFRITKQHGECIIDLPNYYVKAGAHHWKAQEHIWFFNTDQFQELLEKTGFQITDIKHPIESKTVFYVRKPRQNRVKVLLPPGMGDSYWSLVKLQSFMASKGIKDVVDCYIVCNKDKAHNGHKRTFPFLEMVPFINSTDMVFANGNNPEYKKIWKEAYSKAGKTIFKDVHGCDYFIAYNGRLGAGDSLENTDKHLKCNWDIPFFVSLEQERYKKECRNKYGKYVVFYFVFYGHYQQWLKEFNKHEIAAYVNSVVKQTGYTPIFTGAVWDKSPINKVMNEIITGIPDAVDLRGETSMEQLFGLMKGSEGVVGFPSGLTIMSAALGIKTITIWNGFYNRDFAVNCVPPKVRGKTYMPVYTNDITAGSLTKDTIKLLTGKDSKIRLTPRFKRTSKGKGGGGIKSKRKPNNDTAIITIFNKSSQFGIEYVDRLHSAIKRNTTIAHQFICLTESANMGDKISGQTKQLRAEYYDKDWAGVELFRPDLTSASRIVYIDLNTVITGDIDNIILLDGKFISLKPWGKLNRANRYCGINIMSWINDGSYDYIYDNYHYKHRTKYANGLQEYIAAMLKSKKQIPEYFQDKTNGIYSYKRECKNGLPKGARIVIFNNRLMPHNCGDSWIKDSWK